VSLSKTGGLLFVFICVAQPTAADELSPASPPSLERERPTIALVLSGGGARGASHIGILQVFEELRIPIDYVTGNSMGAIVGGFYAAGYSPDQLEEELTSIDWIDIFRDLPARQYLPFRRKQDTRDFRVGMRLSFDRKGFHFPTALVQAQKLDLMLQRLGMPVWDVRNFDDLPLPFRSVATDIETGEAVILGEGSLHRAIQASMAVPGAFAPVDMGDLLLVDGMVSNNIPIDAALAFEPDIVIAVDIGTPPLTRENIQSVFSVSLQMLSLLM
jgi:NTE family protein